MKVLEKVETAQIQGRANLLPFINEIYGVEVPREETASLMREDGRGHPKKGIEIMLMPYKTHVEVYGDNVAQINSDLHRRIIPDIITPENLKVSITFGPEETFRYIRDYLATLIP